MHKKHLGQYFTPPQLADFMVSLSTAPRGAAVLEPAAGEGVILQSLARAGFADCEGFEVDATLTNRSAFLVHRKSFVSHPFTKSYDLIVGNPPYVRWKNLDENLRSELEREPLWKRHFNNLADYLSIFLLKSVELLNEGGELIFITPDYWLSNAHSANLRNHLVANGCFECIYHFSETPLFQKVAASVIVFRYRKTKRPPPPLRLVKYTGRRKPTAADLQALLGNEPSANKELCFVPPFRENANWLLSTENVAAELDRYEDRCRHNGRTALLGDLADIGNGMVSGLDKAFQRNNRALNKEEERCLLAVAKAKDLAPYTIKCLTEYIFVNEAGVESEAELRERLPNVFAHLEAYREALQKRYSYKRDIKYWDWVFLRNHKLFQKAVNKIFVPSKERISHKAHFRFALAPPGVFPTQDVTCLVPKESTRESVYYMLALLNSAQVFTWMKHKGSLKGAVVEFYERPLYRLPFRCVDWNNPADVRLHEKIVQECKAVTEGSGSKEALAALVAALFEV